MSRRGTDWSDLVADHVRRNPELFGAEHPARSYTPPAKRPSPFALAAHPDDRAAIEAREKRSAAAATSHAHGEDLEGWLNDQHDAARMMGLADLEKLNPAVAVGEQLGDGWFRARWKGRTGGDYRGTLRGGLSACVEAKHAGEARLKLVVDVSKARHQGLQPHQRRALDHTQKLGGVALVVVRFTRQRDGRPVDTTYAAPWDAICHLESIGPDDVAAYRVRSDVYLSPWVSR